MNAVPLISLLVTSGDGPSECRLAVAHVVRRIGVEAKADGVTCAIELPDGADVRHPPSALVQLKGRKAREFASRWTGTIRWTVKSPFRPHHKRRNWFVGVSTLDTGPEIATGLQSDEIRFETFRAGGPGGQHQNTTDSAVRATHEPTGISVVSRDQRSQHRNREVAVERLSARLALRALHRSQQAGASRNQRHKELERGNPVRCFKGERFQEV
ncbi:peptide chain release factor H [Flavimaribacter sediminis]|uniref:peptide chain release factor H n=1 Tax=Flavimaribacter sediminis TaxID=2865987 RepID=UPI00215D8A0E|nr:peptide chain release factor H [Flavimaribacter sediminis]